jgi:tetratricopeptide (TPR) repeat protein
VWDDSPLPERGGELSLLSDSGCEIDYFATLRDVPSLRSILLSAYNNHRALSFTLSGMDPDLGDRTRRLCVGAANDLCQSDVIHRFVQRRLTARPLPPAADLEGAIRIAGGEPLISQLYAHLRQAQSTIHQVNAAFTHAAEEFFIDEVIRGEAEKLLVDRGVIESVMNAVSTGRPAEFNRVILAFSLERDLIARIPRLPQFLTRLRGAFGLAKRGDYAESAAPEPESNVAAATDGIVERDPIVELLAQLTAEPGHRAVRSHGAKQRVDRQIEAITAAIRAGDLARADDFLIDLVRYQVESSRPEHLGKTFSQLAQVAVQVNQPALATRLLAYAGSLGVVDPVLSVQAGRLLHRSHHLPEALSAYDEAISRFPTDGFALNGRAEVLKEMGRMAEALWAYDETISRFPRDVVARNGRAEVLKQMGQMAEALLAYEETISRFPTDVFAQAGRAEVLKEMGRLPEALSAYEEAISRFPSNAVAQSGRAVVLKEMGLLQEALSAYEETISRFPSTAAAQNGRAEVFKEMGRLAEALSSYEETISRFPTDVFAQAGRAEVLREMGRLEEALSAYDEAISRFPNDMVPQNGRAVVLKEMGRTAEALSAYEETISRFPTDVFARAGRAEVLKETGRLVEALSAYDETIDRFPSSVVAQAGRAEVLKEMGQLEEALSAYDEVVSRFASDQVTRNGRAGLLVLMGRTDEARSALPVSAPVGRQEWIGYHIRCMSYVRERELTVAIEHLAEGAASVTWPRVRRAFESALAIALMQKRDYARASEVLTSAAAVAPETDRNLSLLLLAHAEAAMGRRAEALLHVSGTGHAGPQFAWLEDAIISYYSLVDLSNAALPVRVPSLEAIEIREFELVLKAV